MEAAAKTVEYLSQRILPEKPHHLSSDPEWRYRAGPGDAKPFEEWHNPRLQYLTLVSEADRGVLLTRSHYDIREDPVKPPLPREVNALAKGGAEKKKLSLSDYRNKRTGATSTSPPEPSIAKKKESERTAANAAEGPAAASLTPTPSPSLSKPASDPRPASEARKPDKPKPREPDPSADAKQRQPREPAADARSSSNLKPPTKHPLPPRPPTPNSRKRAADADEEARPQKRPKPDISRSGDERSQLPRDDAQRRKDRAPSAGPSRDVPSHKDDKPASSSSSAASSTLPNGRAMMKNAVGSGRNASPGSRPRGDSINGVRPAVTGNNRTTPTKPEATTKPFVPPLLSPLHLSFDDRNTRDIPPAKVEKKKREEARDGARSPKHRKTESVLKTKKQRSPLRIPPLLSPTLPPVVEAALQSRKKGSLDSFEGRAKDRERERERDTTESPSKRKKPPVDYSDDEEPISKSQRKSLVVTLKLPKRLRQTFKRMQAFAASTATRREAQAHDHERPAVEEPVQPPAARKRPVVSADGTEATATATAHKKPRPSDMPSSSRLPAPSTPSKKAPTAMSRVSSSNSLAQTPGETVNATPSASNTADRRINGQDSLKPEKPEAKVMREKEARFSSLGRRLKHQADMVMKGGVDSQEPNPKLCYVLSMESLLAFMAGFHAQNTYRGLCNKRSDPTGWASLFPFMEFLQKELRRQEGQTRRYLPLVGLLLLLHATAIDELIKCYSMLENPGIALADLLRFERIRARAWPQIREANAVIDKDHLRVDSTPWASLDEITLSSLRILRHWCAAEDVDWVPDATLKEPVVPAKNTTQSHSARSW